MLACGIVALVVNCEMFLSNEYGSYRGTYKGAPSIFTSFFIDLERESPDQSNENIAFYSLIVF